MRHTQHFVEELTERHETPVGKMVPLSSITPDPNQPRSTMGDLGDLESSIREKGVLEPILIRPRPGESESADPGARGKVSDLYIIISGERRYQAALAAGLYDIPAVILDVAEDEALEIALIENLQRKDLTPFEEAEGYQALASRHGYTHERIAETVGRSRTLVTETLLLLQIPPKVRDAVQALGIQSKSILLEVLKADSEEAMILLVEEAARRNWTRDDLRRQAKRKKPGARRKPFSFKFRAPDKSYRFNLSFRRSDVAPSELIETLEEILKQLREAQEEN